MIYDKLVEFGSQCLEEEQCTNSGNNAKLEAKLASISLKDSTLFSSPRKVTLQEVSSAAQRNKRHPVTGKGRLCILFQFSINI